MVIGARPSLSWCLLLAAGVAAAGCAASLPQATTEEPPPAAAVPEEPGPEWVTQAVAAVNVERILFSSGAIGREVSAHIYLPDAYSADPARRFPVLYWLHGSGPGIQGIPFMAGLFHRAIAQGAVRPMIIVFPNGLSDGMWVDSKDARRPLETILIHELIPHVDREYRTIGSPQGRVIEGFSMGGYGAARLGFKYPDRFAGISILGAGPLQLDFLEVGPRMPRTRRQHILDMVYGGSLEYFQAQSPWRLAEALAEKVPPGPGVPVRVVVGTADELLDVNRRFHEHLDALRIPHDFVELQGVAHDPAATLRALGPDLWTFYERAFGR